MELDIDKFVSFFFFPKLLPLALKVACARQLSNTVRYITKVSVPTIAFGCGLHSKAYTLFQFELQVKVFCNRLYECSNGQNNITDIAGYQKL